MQMGVVGFPCRCGTFNPVHVTIGYLITDKVANRACLILSDKHAIGTRDACFVLVLSKRHVQSVYAALCLQLVLRHSLLHGRVAQPAPLSSARTPFTSRQPLTRVGSSPD